MFYNNTNPYNSYPYTIYNNQPQPQYQQNMYQGQPMQQQSQVQQPQNNQQNQVQQQIYFPLTFVRGLEEAKAFILNPNQTAYLRDSENKDIMYIKTLDSQGIPNIQIKRLVDFKPDENNKNNNKEEKSKINFDDYIKKEDIAGYLSSYLSKFNFIKKDDLNNYPTMEDFTKFDIKVENDLERLTKQIDKLLSNRNNNFKKSEQN